jgi:hypothetical protein
MPYGDFGDLDSDSIGLLRGTSGNTDRLALHQELAIAHFNSTEVS